MVMDFRMPAQAHLTGLTLRVRGLDRQLAFYRDVLGLEVARRAGGADLRHADGAFTLTLLDDPQAPPHPPRAVGLYHFALLLPRRAALGAVLRRLLAARHPLDGASDHGVSEALYLRDPEGNGIELAWDRPRERWPRKGDDLTMISRALDLEDLVATAPSDAGLDPQTQLGHMHLSVDSLPAGEQFYAGGLGLKVTQRDLPGALFLAAGDYHHHLGLNTWGGGRPRPTGSAGLVRYGWRLPAGTLERLTGHLAATGMPASQSDTSVTVTDPVGIEVRLAEAPVSVQTPAR